MFPTPTPAKERLSEKLLAPEKLLVKQALFSFLAQNDPQLKDITFEKMQLESLLPIMAQFSTAWQTLDAADFVTSYQLINGIYHLVRNQFRTPDTLKKHIKEFIDEQEGNEDCSFSDQPEIPMQTRGQLKTQPQNQTISKVPKNSKENMSSKKQKFEVQKQPKTEEHEVIQPRNPSPPKEQPVLEQIQVSAPQPEVEKLILSIFKRKRDIKVLEKQVSKLLKLDQWINEQMEESD